jgi:hypothetical protein
MNMCRSAAKAGAAISLSVAAAFFVPDSATAIGLSPPPVLSPPSTNTVGIVANDSVIISEDNCSNTGANCTSLGTSNGVGYAAEALFTPNLLFPYFINPSVSAYVSNTQDFNIDVAASVAYNFEVTVPTNNLKLIPIDLTASGFINDQVPNTNSTISIAELYIVNSLGQNVANYCAGSLGGGVACGGSGPIKPSFSVVNKPIYIVANQVYTVSIVAFLGPNFGPGILTATVDPFISIDPATLSEYPDSELFLSPGVQQSNQSVTPVPASWALMLTGLGFFGFFGARRGASRTQRNNIRVFSR